MLDTSVRPCRAGASTLQNVVIVNDYAVVNGGQAKVAIETALGLRQQGLAVSFVAGVGSFDPRLSATGVECVSAGSCDILSDPDRIGAARRGIWNLEAARVLDRHLSFLDPKSTVMHVHGWAKALSPSIGSVIAKSVVPTVYTLHEYFLACPNGGFYDYKRGEICTRRPLGLSCLSTNCDSRHLAHKAWRVARQAALWTVGRMPGCLKDIIYLAPRQREVMARYMHPAARWHHLPNPVPARPAERARAETSRHFLFIGRLSPEKGAVLAAIAARIAGAEIAFAGEGEDADAIRAANPSARMLGWLSDARLAEQLGHARALIFPSLWYECYPLVVADALRLGVPVLISDSSIATTLVAHGRSGLHVPGGDAAALALGMEQLSDDATVRRMSIEAFAAGAELVDARDHVQRSMGIYTQILEGSANVTSARLAAGA